MAQRAIIFTLFTIIYLSGFSLPNGNDFLKLLGEPADNPELASMMSELEFAQHSASFDRSTNTYEIKAFESGIALYFNQNFILKEIQYFDSGYTYSSFKGKLPMNLTLRVHHTYFRETYVNFDPDSFNQFIYHGRFAHGTADVYFKSNHVEMVRLKADDDFIADQDRKYVRTWGIRIIPDGTCIDGNCYTGSGKMAWPTGLEYDGNWAYGIPNGAGQMQDTLGMSFSGTYRLGFLWGEGALTVPGQYTYKGLMLMGKKYGEGEIRYQNGTRYSGQWQSDLMQGTGHYYYSSTFHYKGEFSNNQFNGKGILYTPEGYLDGHFKDGKPHGAGIQVATSNQSTLQGKWVNGKKEGEFVAFNPLLGTYNVVFENDIEIRKMRVD